MTRLLFPLALLLCTVACDGPAPTVESAAGPDVPEHSTPPAPPADKDVAFPAPAEGDKLPVNVASSTIAFVGRKVTGSHDGGFKAFEGDLVQKDGAVVGTSFVIEISSTFSDSEKLTGHLLKDDFFDAANHPQARFVSSKITAAASPGAISHMVEGVLEMRGKRRPLSFPATITASETSATVQASFDINRQNWGVSYPGKPDNLISDDVKIKLDLTFSPAAQ